MIEYKLEQAADLLNGRKNIFLDVELLNDEDNPVMLHRKEHINGNAGEILRNAAERYNASRMRVSVFLPNGASKKRESKFIVTVDQTLSGGPSPGSSLLSPMSGLAMPAGPPESWQSYVISDLQSKVLEEKTRNQKLEAENDRLKTQNADYKEKLAFKDKEHELEIRSNEIESSGTLNGFLERASQNEKFMEVLGTLAERLLSGAATPDQVTANLPSHAQVSDVQILDGNEDQQFIDEKVRIIRIITIWLQKQPLSIVQKFFEIVQTAQNNGSVDFIEELLQA